MIGSIASRAAATVVVVVDRNIFIQYVLLLLLQHSMRDKRKH